MFSLGISKRKEIGLGLFIIIALVLLFLGIIFIKNDISIFKRRYIIKVKFGFVEGLKPASPVRFCGVDVGEVEKLEIVKERGEKPYVIVWAKIDKNIRIPRDSKIFINSLTLFGEKYLEISPSATGGDYLKEGDIVEGVTGLALFDVLYAFNKTLKELDKFIKEGRLRSLAEDIVVNIKEITSELSEIIKKVKDGEGVIGKLIYDDTLYTRINRLLKRIEEEKGTVGKLLYDDRLYRDLEELIEELKRNPWKLLYKPKKRNLRQRRKKKEIKKDELRKIPKTNISF